MDPQVSVTVTVAGVEAARRGRVRGEGRVGETLRQTWVGRRGPGPVGLAPGERQEMLGRRGEPLTGGVQGVD